jgi:hypothetical protein
MNHRILTTTLCALAGTLLAGAQVPGLINYQGRLTDANGAPVTGSKNFSLSIYDAATGGNLLYTENIGAVTLDDNGVYSFHFGSAGTSNSQVTETIATTDASTLVYTKALANSGVVENSLSVTDGTNSWTQSAGNPGIGAAATANITAGFVTGATITNGGSGYTSPPAVTITGLGSGAAATATLSSGVVTGITITNAGSGYTGGATISIAPPVIPFRVEYGGGAITATYSSAPAAGTAITATYRYDTSGISGALSGAAEQWMAVSVDGTIPGTRQRVLAVPFAISANSATVAERSKQPSENVFLNVKNQVGGGVGGSGSFSSVSADVFNLGTCYFPNDLSNPILRSNISWVAGTYNSGRVSYDLKFEFIAGNKIFHVENLTRRSEEAGRTSAILESAFDPRLIDSGFRDFRIRATISNHGSGVYTVSTQEFTADIILVNRPL